MIKILHDFILSIHLIIEPIMTQENNTTEAPCLTDEAFFDWLRSRQPNNYLTQDMVDGAKALLVNTSTDDLQASLTKIIVTGGTNGVGSAAATATLTRADIYAAARGMSIEPATLKAVIDIECPNPGFGADGKPTILFEAHKMWKYLGKANFITKRNQLNALFPDMCTRYWDKSLYKVRPSHEKLAVCEVLHWEAAHMSCSWGKGQVMGFNWEDLKYPSLKAFVDAMYESEAKQLDAMCRFIKVNKLVDELQRHDWAGFAYRYNGEGYAANKYDIKLAQAYLKAKREGY